MPTTVTTMFRDSITLGGCALEEHVKAEGRYGIGSNSASSCDNGGERPEGTYTETADTSLVIDIESDSGYSFHSVTGRNTYDYQDGIDADWLPVQFVGRADISNYEQTSQEFRIASPTDERFSFVAGVYWSESEQEIDRVVQVDGTLGNPLNRQRRNRRLVRPKVLMVREEQTHSWQSQLRLLLKQA